ncbi:MAG: SAM-dependent methyltransferase, partial [Pseudolabrys sp.]
MTSPIFLSSGDVIADRRFEWARDREAKGDLTGAADLLVQV